jgi:hypothetical protein
MRIETSLYDLCCYKQRREGFLPFSLSLYHMRIKNSYSPREQKALA